MKAGTGRIRDAGLPVH